MAVVIPLRNEAAHLAETIAAVLAQRYDGPLEVVAAVAPSSDGSKQVAQELFGDDDRVRIIDNPAGSTPAGLNAAIRATEADVIVRVDGHCVIPPGYVAAAVRTLRETGAANVGGVQAADGETGFEAAVAHAMTSRFGVGDAKFHYGGSAGPTDTVYLGVFRRDAVDEVGLFDEGLIRNQDYELNWRLRAAGHVVWFDPTLRVRYRPRGTLRSLARQFFEYGQWKREVVRRHPGSLRWRQAVPPIALVGLAGSLLLGVTCRRRFLVVPATYGAAVLAAATPAVGQLGLRGAARLACIYPTMHMSWGLGFLVGPPRRRAPRAAAGADPRLRG